MFICSIVLVLVAVDTTLFSETWHIAGVFVFDIHMTVVISKYRSIMQQSTKEVQKEEAKASLNISSSTH